MGQVRGFVLWGGVTDAKDNNAKGLGVAFLDGKVYFTINFNATTKRSRDT